MESQSELVGGEQNNQTVQPLVADENDQNVKSKADGKKKAKSPGTDKKYREKKKQKTEDTEKQLGESRSKIDELENKNAYLTGKVDQALIDLELVLRAPNLELIRHRTLPFEATGFGTGEKGLPAHNPPVHQFGTTTGLGGLTVEHPRGLPRSQLSQGRTHQKNHDEYLKADRPLIGVFGDYPNNISPPRAAMASGSSPMQGSLAPGGQRNTVEQPALSYDGLAQGGGLLGSHGLCYTSPPGAAMASGSSPMQGSLAPGGQAYLPLGGTGFGTGETGLPGHHPPVHQCGTTMGSGGLAVEDSPGLPQLELSQEWMHLPSFGIGDQESTSSIENLSMPSTPILENLSMSSTPILENDWIEDQYNAPTRMP